MINVVYIVSILYLFLREIIADDTHTLDILRLHKNNVFGRFESENHAVSHVHSQLNDLLDSESIHHHVQNNFVITVATGFDFDRMRAAIGSGKIESFSDRHLLISTEPATLKLLLAANQDIVHAVPVVSAMKVSDSVYSSGSIECEGLASASKKLMLESAALSPDDLHTFLDSLHTLSSALSPPLAFADSDLVPHRRSFLKIAVPCEHYLTTALSLAQLRQVLWIEHFNDFSINNYWARGVLESGLFSNAPILRTANMSGQGQIIGVADTGLDIYSNYFYDPSYDLQADVAPNTLHRKIVSYATKSDKLYGNFGDIYEGHGTHVCGIIAGKAYNNYGDFKRFNGIAADAKISFFDISNTSTNSTIDVSSTLNTPSDLNTNLLVPLYNTGARIFSNSWGSLTGVGYDDSAKQVDEFICNYPETLVLFATGNSGDRYISPTSPIVSSVGSPAIFKNGLAVGAGLNDAQSWSGYIAGLTAGQGTTIPQQGVDSMAAFSSRGPTYDNRMKPEVLGPGAMIYSATGEQPLTKKMHTGINAKQGTSMATPAVAAIAAVVRQYFMEGYYNSPYASKSSANAFVPSGALLKAMIIASSVKVNNIYYSTKYNYEVLSSPYPSNDQGYGRVQINNVLNFGPASTSPLTLSVIGDTSDTGSLYREFTANTIRWHLYTFSVAATQTVKIVLAYTDCPGSSSSSNTIQNILSLSVNGGGVTYSPQAPTGNIIKNTVQWIAIQATAGVTYSVNVSCASFAAGRSQQAYALVMAGNVQKLPPTTADNILLESKLSLEDIPYVEAIIGMSVIAGVLLLTTVSVFVAECLAERGVYFQLHKW